jgi:hypothetical protein
METDELETVLPLLAKHGVLKYKSNVQTGEVEIEFRREFLGEWVPAPQAEKADEGKRLKDLIDEVNSADRATALGRNHPKLWGPSGPPSFPGVNPNG